MKIPSPEKIQAFIDKRKEQGKDTTKQEKLLKLAKAGSKKSKPSEPEEAPSKPQDDKEKDFE